jgi:F-type H+-transporting ATPase subunit a
MPMMTNLLLAAADPAEHVVNHSAVVRDGWWIWSGHQGNLVLSGLILVVVGLWVASKVKIGPASQGAEAYVTRNSFAHLIEVICSYLRDEVVKPLLPDRTSKFMPFLWTVFFFILVNNLLGLVPILDVFHVAGIHSYWLGGTATQNVWVTGVLAIVAAIVFNIAAIARLGVGGFVSHLTGGAPFPVSILLLFLEGLGQIAIKPVALTVRLAANMTAGHILLATLAMFVAQVWDQSIGLKAPITLISVVGGMAVMLLELFVAFLQAFIFMFLTTIFISLMDHHDEHGHEHGHDHADHGHEHAHA